MSSKQKKLPSFTDMCSTSSLVLHIHTLVTSKYIKHIIFRQYFKVQIREFYAQNILQDSNPAQAYNARIL